MEYEENENGIDRIKSQLKIGRHGNTGGADRGTMTTEDRIIC